MTQMGRRRIPRRAYDRKHHSNPPRCHKSPSRRQPMRRRANLWSLGDVNGLLALTFPDERVACFNALFSVPRLHDQLEEAGGPLESEWLAAADSALTRNESSFAVIPISQLLKPDGWLAKLRARGYSVRDPDARD